MRHLAVTATLLFASTGAFLRAEEITALPDDNVPEITAVTGFHSFEDKKQTLFVRLIEADESADVAKNPVALFLVVTNDAGGPDLQVKVWPLPAVAAVRKATLTASGLRVSAAVDGMVDEKTGRLPERTETLTVRYTMEHGQLSDKIRVDRSQP